MTQMLSIPGTRNPDWRLADELLRRGEKDIAGKYIHHNLNALEKHLEKIAAKPDQMTEREMKYFTAMVGQLRTWLEQLKGKRLPRLGF